MIIFNPFTSVYGIYQNCYAYCNGEVDGIDIFLNDVAFKIHNGFAGDRTYSCAKNFNHVILNYDHIPRIGLVGWDRASSAYSVLMETLLRGGEEGNRILILGSLLLKLRKNAEV